MKDATKVILVAALTAFLLGPAPKTPKGQPGDISTQLKLKQKLLAAMGKTKLAESLAHVQSEWESLTPDQRNRFREQALAFLRKNDQQQEELLERYEKLIKLTAERRQQYRQRANWLTAVVEWLEKNDPKRIEQIKAMRPLDRARELIALRDALVRENKISLPPATTRPASEQEAPAGKPAPTSQPSSEQQ